MRPRVVAIVVSWNQRALTLEAIRSLIDSDYSDLNIVVVDNGSRDGSVEAYREAFPAVRIIANGGNLGYAVANNQGWELATQELGADLVLFFNNDAVMQPGGIEALVQELQDHPECGAVGSYITYASATDTIWYVGGDVSLFTGQVRHRMIRRKLAEAPATSCETEYITGCSMMVRANILRELGGFDPMFTLYSEDVDLSLRLRSAGWKLRVVPQSLVYHHISASTGGAVSPFKIYHRARSTAILLKRWAPWYAWWGLASLGLVGFLAAAVTLVAKGSAGSVVSLVSGVTGGMFSTEVPVKYRLSK